MQLRANIQLQTMIKALNDVIIPAIDGNNSMALEQAHIMSGMMALMQQQLPIQYRFDLDELTRLLDTGQALLALATDQDQLGSALRDLSQCCEKAVDIVNGCTIQPEQIVSAIEELRVVIGKMATLQSPDSDTDVQGLTAVDRALLEMSKNQLIRDRALLISQGWELNPGDIAEIDTLLGSVPAISR